MAIDIYRRRNINGVTNKTITKMKLTYLFLRKIYFIFLYFSSFNSLVDFFFICFTTWWLLNELAKCMKKAQRLQLGLRQ